MMILQSNTAILLYLPLYKLYISDTVISQVTLGLFEDSGWYKVNYSAGLVNQDKFLWGASKYLLLIKHFVNTFTR